MWGKGEGGSGVFVYLCVTWREKREGEGMTERRPVHILAKQNQKKNNKNIQAVVFG